VHGGRKNLTNTCIHAKIDVRSHVLAEERGCALNFRDLVFKRN
jgi:hypothetical protein